MGRGNRISNKIYDDFMLDESTVAIPDNKNITEESLAQEETTGPETINGIIVNGLHVKVRTEPNFESDVLDVLRKGDKVTILGKENGFYKISIKPNKVAYISSDFIKEE